MCTEPIERLWKLYVYLARTVFDIEGQAVRFVFEYYMYVITTSVCTGTLAKAKMES